MDSAYKCPLKSNSFVRSLFHFNFRLCQINVNGRSHIRNGAGRNGMPQVVAHPAAEVQTNTAGFPISSPIEAGIAILENAGQVRGINTDSCILNP